MSNEKYFDDPANLFKSNFPKDWRSDVKYQPDATEEEKEKLRKSWENNKERKAQAAETAREVLQNDEEVALKRKEILSEVYKTEEWKNAQTEGAQRNAAENKEWYKKTVEKNKRIAKDPARTKKIVDTKKAKASADPSYLDNVKENNKKLRAKKVKTPKGEFESLREAAEAEGIAENTLRRYIKQGKEGYWSETKNSHYKRTGKPIKIPEGVFESKSAAGIFLHKQGLPNAEKKLDKWLKENPSEYYYIEENKNE